VNAYGTVDETNATVGMARQHSTGEIDAALARIQNDLFDLGADLCRPGDPSDGKLRIAASQVTRLEQEIDAINAHLAELTSFILPGGSRAAAQAHVCRTVCRRAERNIVELGAHETLNPLPLQYVNRLSDLMFVLARVLNRMGGGSDVLWQQRKNQAGASVGASVGDSAVGENAVSNNQAGGDADGR
jgi:cob(I)alamin adenosyltransferase